MSVEYFYRAYDFHCRSEARLPELRSASGHADVEIRMRHISRKLHSHDSSDIAVEVDRNTAWLSHHTFGSFCVHDGRSISVDPVPGVDAALIRLQLLGPAFGTLLRQRGRLTLHASAVELDRVGVVFVGSPGAGKSTLAAAFHARGCRLLADDVVAIDATLSHPVVFPGFPRLKLDARSAAATIPVPRLRRVHSKRYFSATRAFATTPIPLGQVFVLTEADICAVDRLQPHEGLIELLRHSYGARSLQVVNREKHFEQCAMIAGRVPVRRLRLRRDLGELTAIVDLIERDLSTAA